MDLLICLTLSILSATAWSTATGARRSELVSIASWAFGIQCLIFKLYRLIIYPRLFSPLRKLPGPMDHHFLLGHTIREFTSGSPNEPFTSWMRKWPEQELIRYITIGNKEAVLVTGLQALKEVLQTNAYTFVKPAGYKRVSEPIVGKGLFLMDGHQHRMHRKLLNGSFSTSNLKGMVPVLKEKARELSEYMQGLIDGGNGVFEAVSTFSSITLDIIGVGTIGEELESLSSVTPFHKTYRRIFDPPWIGLLLLGLSSVMPIRWLPIQENKEFKKANGLIHKLLLDKIRQRSRELAEMRQREKDTDRIVTNTRRDLLTYIIEETHAKGVQWDEENVLGHILVFMAGGHEPASCALVWAAHFLTQYPDAQSRLRVEIRDLLARNPNPEWEDIDRLPFLENYLREVLRFQNPAVASPRVTLRDVEICGVTLPKGTRVDIMPNVIHMNPRIWGPNADKFDPDRWDSPAVKAAPPYAFAAFLTGPTGCIGRAFAMLEIKIILIELLRRFELEAVAGTPVELVNPGPLLRPKGGLKIRAGVANV